MTSITAAASTRFGGLDGLRAIAVTLVLVYHFFPGTLTGGFLGVDVFFVISGFLITSLLQREWESTGRISLASFWRRRARRLLPALGVVLLVCSGSALLIGGDVLVSLGAQIAGSTFFVSNWVFIGLGIDYFARDTPELFRNTWSLSIEEQFYLLLPLLLLAVLHLPSRSWRAMPFATLSLGSAVLMFALSLGTGEPTRTYFGSDTHTFGLFLGVALALSLRPTAPTAQPRRWLQPITLAATAIGLSTLLWLAFTLREGSPESFEGGLQLATLAALITVWAVTRPGAVVGKMLDCAPLRWVGERSYGIYLWHWPVYVLLTASSFARSLPVEMSWLTGVLALLITVPVAALSYRYLELPIRRRGLIRSIRALVSARPATPRRRIGRLAVALLLIVTVPATAVAVITAPRQTSAAEAIARGEEAMRQQAESVVSAVSGVLPATPLPADKPAPPPVTGPDIWAVGDSVMLASAGELSTALPGISIDADVSRSFGYGVTMIEQQQAAGLKPVLVIGLSTNGQVTAPELDWLEAVSAGSRIVLVNAYGDRWWIPEANQNLAAFADAHRGVVVADWNAAIASHPELLAEDGIHPGDQGAVIYAQVVQDALVELNSPTER